MLYSFLCEHTVASFRASELSKEFFKMVDENQRKMTLKGAGNLIAGTVIPFVVFIVTVRSWVGEKITFWGQGSSLIKHSFS